MTGYVRQEEANIVNDQQNDASHLNNEYNAIVQAFAQATGHKHDGTAAEGAYVPIISDSDKHNYITINGDTIEFWIDDTGAGTPVKQLTISNGVITPETDSDVDIGTTLKRIKDFYVDSIVTGTATITAGTIAGATIVAADNTITTAPSGNLTSTNLNAALAELQADVDTRAVSSTLTTHTGATAAHGATGAVVGTTNAQTLTNKTLTSPTVNTPTISGGTIDTSVIGGTIPAAGNFTTLEAADLTTNGKPVAIESTLLTSADDLGTVFTPGFYHWDNANAPVTANTYGVTDGTMQVVQSDVATNQYFQFIRGSSATSPIVRSKSRRYRNSAWQTMYEYSNTDHIHIATQNATMTTNITLDFSIYSSFNLTFPAGNVTLDNPSTELAGQHGYIAFIQDSIGGRTLSLGTDYETAAGAGLTLSTAPNAVDIVPYYVRATGKIMLGSPQLNFS
jgi:hypothetical protein